MPYLVKVGYERRNLLNVTSKGYFIKRVGTKVYTQWGAIIVSGLIKKRISWYKTTAYKYHAFKTITIANRFKKMKILSLLVKGYNQLPSGSRIYSK